MKHENVQSFVVHFLHPEDLFIAASRMTFLGTKQKKQNSVAPEKSQRWICEGEFWLQAGGFKKKKKKLT